MNPFDVPEVDPEEARSLLEDGAQLLDVRRPEEFREAHIAGTQFITLSELTRRFAELDRERKLVVYCKSGGRSAQAAAWLNARGFDAVNLKGGLDDWQLQGLPVGSAEE